MKIKSLFIILLIIGFGSISAQSNKSEIENITTTLIDYIEGSTNGQPKRLKKAFHKDLNLYYIKNSELKIWSGKKYIESTKEGKPTGETGEIISIDFENDIAVAKVQISHPKKEYSLYRLFYAY